MRLVVISSKVGLILKSIRTGDLLLYGSEKLLFRKTSQSSFVAYQIQPQKISFYQFIFLFWSHTQRYSGLSPFGTLGIEPRLTAHEASDLPAVIPLRHICLFIFHWIIEVNLILKLVQSKICSIISSRFLNYTKYRIQGKRLESSEVQITIRCHGRVIKCWMLNSANSLCFM